MHVKQTLGAVMLMRVTALCLLAGIALPAHASSVPPPPRTPGSELIKIAPGQSQEETSRMIRAHSHKHKKDHKRDDSKHESSRGPKHP